NQRISKRLFLKQSWRYPGKALQETLSRRYSTVLSLVRYFIRLRKERKERLILEDKKSNLYSMSNKMKNGWTQNGSSMREKPETRPVAPVNPVMPETKPAMPIMPGTKPTVPEMKMVMPAETPGSMESQRIAHCETYVMVKINMQEWDETYDPNLGFERGTIFSSLDFPFVGEGACRYE
ncbi:MAG: spore coat associated protein CotJA, partial [Puniceicoccales bacterium]|nr:spore coat associated protein CotJA [Puniceicoccales bacterium]